LSSGNGGLCFVVYLYRKKVASLRWKIAQFCERIWWRLYLRKRDKTAYLTWKRSYWSQFLQDVQVNVPAGSTIADLGCGPAGIFIAFDSTCKIEAIDPLLGAYQSDLAHFNQVDYPNVVFQQSPIEDWKPALDQYSHLFCINAINHVANLEAAFAQIKQAASSGTTVVITTDAHRSKLLQRIFALAPGDILHPHQHTLEGYIQIAQRAGFTAPEAILLKREAIFDYYALVWRG
jgi:SAM-dependent methyltransferase